MQRRASSTGVIMAVRQKIALGSIHKHQTATVLVSETTPAVELKHRPRGETRPVPIHPELVALLNQHLKNYPPGPDGRVFTGPRGGIFNDRAYLKIFHKARAAAFTPGETASLLARRPYDLRHAAVSTWLNAGVPAPQVADWAGHSVDVLLRVYAKCISGQQAEAKRRIEEATRPRYDE